MTYEKLTWVDGDKSRPLSAARLTHMGEQYETAMADVEAQIGDPESPIGIKLSAKIADAVTGITNDPQFVSEAWTPGAPAPIFPRMDTFAVFGSSSDSQFGTRLAAAFTSGSVPVAVVNRSRSGERWEHTLARCGIALARITFTANTVPASGAVNVETNLPNLSYLLSYRGRIEGTDVIGALAMTSSGGPFVFTREGSGSAVVLDGPVNFIPTATNAGGIGLNPAYRDALSFPNCGKNNCYDIGAWVGINSAHDALVNWFVPLQKRFLVLGFFANTGADAIHKENVAQVNAHRAARYGSLFLDIQEYVIGEDVWTHTGITPTSGDLAQQTAGVKPTSLSIDNAHLIDAAWDTFIEHVAIPRLVALGWISEPTPEDPMITSDGFSGTDGAALIGRMSDAAAGGTPQEWRVTGSLGDGIVLAGGAVQFPQGGTAAFVPATDADVEVSARIVTRNGNFTVGARCASTVAGTSNDHYRATVVTTNVVRLEKRFSSATTTISTGTHAFANGDAIGVRCVGDQITLLVNGVAVETVTDGDITTGEYAGLLATFSSAPASVVDDFLVKRA